MAPRVQAAMKTMDKLLAEMTEAGASDLHLKVGRSPILRVEGRLRELSMDRLSSDDLHNLSKEVFSEEQLARFTREHELDGSYQPAIVCDRFRVNAFLRMGMPGMVLRRIPREAPCLADLGFPPVIQELIHSEQGLVLVTGPTGSGKSTTLAAMVRELNETSSLHIVTIEDPIEFVQDDDQCVINQREIGFDTDSFGEALRRSLRQDPDVILIGEMRDAETMRTATTAAETGHLVLSTLHTNDAKQTVDRIVNTFPPEERDQIRLKLSLALRGVISQSLLPHTDQNRRVCVQEILVCTSFVKEAIAKGESFKIDDAIRDAPTMLGMQSKNQSLFDAWQAGKIRSQDALAFSNSPTDLDLMIRTHQFEERNAAQHERPESGAEPAIPDENERTCSEQERGMQTDSTVQGEETSVRMPGDQQYRDTVVKRHKRWFFK